jgi:hypothetical protein
VTASSRHALAAVAVLVAVVIGAGAGPVVAEEPVLRMRASVVGAPAAGSLSIELLRWSSDAERTPVLAAMTPPPAPPAPPAGAPAAAAGGRAGARGGARGGGRGAAPASLGARLSAAIAAAPTVGFIWGAGPTGYSVKYAWRSPSAGEVERIVLVTDRRLGAHATAWPATPPAPDDEQYTVVEIRIDKKGAGEAKTSLTTGVVVDAAAQTLALNAYATTPTLLEVMR